LASGGERSIKARKNISISLFAKVIGMIIMYLMVPISISYLGVENYGVWIVLSGIIAWAGMFDFGLSHGLRNHLAIAITKNQIEHGKSYISTTYFFLFLVSFLIIIAGSLFIYTAEIQIILNTDTVSENVLKIVAMIVLLLFSVNFFLKPINSILQAHQMPSYTQIIGVGGSMLAIIAIYVIITFTNITSFYWYALLVSGAPVVGLLVASIILFSKKFEKLIPSFSEIKRSSLKKIGGLGTKFFIIQLCLLVVYTSDNFIISYLFGPEEVTAYTIPHKYFSALTILFTVIMSPYWSAITEAYTKNEFDWIKKTVRNLSKIILGGLVIAIIMVIFSDSIFKIWIGKKVVVPATLTALMGVYSVLMGIQTLFSYFSNGIGKIRVQTIAYISCAIINLPLSYYFGKTLGMGSTGVLLATVFCLLIISITLFIQYFKITNKTAKGVWLK